MINLYVLLLPTSTPHTERLVQYVDVQYTEVIRNNEGERRLLNLHNIIKIIRSSLVSNVLAQLMINLFIID